jgi:nucleoside 2-deoxyribosyltransferase
MICTYCKNDVIEQLHGIAHCSVCKKPVNAICRNCGNTGVGLTGGYCTCPSGKELERRDAKSLERVMTKVYVASSWRNFRHNIVCNMLRELPFLDVYDFKKPPNKTAFKWDDIDLNHPNWDGDEFRAALQHPTAEAGFQSDWQALQACDVCVLVLPCNRSAHLELGYAVGAGKKTVILLGGETACDGNPELMYKMVDHIFKDWLELLEWFNECERQRLASGSDGHLRDSRSDGVRAVGVESG